MLTEEQQNALIERLLQRQYKANEEVLREIGKVIGKVRQMTPSEAYTIGQQLKYGESLNKIVKILSDTSNINEAEIYSMFEKIAKKNLDFSKKYFLARNIDFIPYEENTALKNLVNEIATATIQTYENIAKTIGLTYLDASGNKVTKGIKTAYREIIDNGIVNVSQGKETLQSALERQLKEIGSNGVQSIEYESGYHRRLDSAMRMNLQDGLNQLAIAQQQLVGEQFDNDGWEVTVHDRPAPDHENIQGHIFSKAEFNKLQNYEYYGEIKDYKGRTYIRSAEHNIRPIGELNCYHFAIAVVLGVDEERYSNKELKEINERNKKGFEFDGKKYTLYEGQQLQRKIETEIRKARESKILAKSGNDENLFNQMQQRETELINKYYKLSKISGIPTRLERLKLIK